MLLKLYILYEGIVQRVIMVILKIFFLKERYIHYFLLFHLIWSQLDFILFEIFRELMCCTKLERWIP